MSETNSAPPDLWPLARPRAAAWMYWCILGLFLLGFVTLAVDLPITRWFARSNCPGDLQKILKLSEVFAHGAGIAGILICIALLDRKRIWAFPRLICMIAASGMAANLVKMMVSRDRPRAFDLTHPVMESFGGFLPMLSAGSKGQGIPSAHTATAIALAVGLCWLYPKGKYLWISLAVLASIQRIDALAHFSSDAVWGMALGLLVSLGILHGWLSNPWLDRLEKWLFARQAKVATAEQAEPLQAQTPHFSQGPRITGQKQRRPYNPATRNAA